MKSYEEELCEEERRERGVRTHFVSSEHIHEGFEAFLRIGESNQEEEEWREVERY